MNSHKLKINTTEYPNGLRFVECDECRYAFMVEFDNGAMQHNTREIINRGDTSAAHTLFQVSEIDVSLEVGANTGKQNE